jgi:sensor domain CHASE-containing protein
MRSIAGMDPFHERLAHVALDAAGSFGFALAGGYAVQAHGFLSRMSSDVDLFAEASAEFDFAQAVDTVVTAYRREGFQVETELRSASFARLAVRADAQSAKVELGLDWRKNQPIRLAVGPVLHADDAVANKVCALFGRAEVRDYVDVDAILSSGRYTDAELLALAADHDPGFEQSWFAEALAAIDRLPDSLFKPYGMSPEDISGLKERMRAWAQRIRAAR